MSLTMQAETGTPVGWSRVNVSVLSFGVWADLLYPGLLGIGWVGLAGFVPPPDPRASPEAIVDLFTQHTDLIRLGMVVCMFGAAMALPLGATVAYLISRVEGFVGPLTLLQVMGAVGMAVITFYPPMWWLAGLYRADTNPAEVTRMVNDLCWFGFIGGLTIYYPTILTMAVAALIDKSELRPFPRWFGLPQPVRSGPAAAQSGHLLLQVRADDLERTHCVLPGHRRVLAVVPDRVRRAAPRGGQGASRAGGCGSQRRRRLSIA